MSAEKPLVHTIRRAKPLTSEEGTNILKRDQLSGRVHNIHSFRYRHDRRIACCAKTIRKNKRDIMAKHPTAFVYELRGGA